MKNKRMMAIIGIVLVASLICVVSADTGTYAIKNEVADLHIQNTSDVIIKYDVDFTVTGGNIPWVTMGLPNSNYDIIGAGGAATSIKKQNNGGWSGVYLGLDKTYYSGETFHYNFSVLQKGFVTRSGDTATIQFTPVWWDNAKIGQLRVHYHPPDGVTSVKTSDKDAIFSTTDNEVAWVWNNVPNGARKTTGIDMPLSAFPSLNTSASAPGSSSGGGGNFIVLVIFGAVVLGFFILLVSMAWSSMSDSETASDFDEYEPPRVYLSSALSGKKVTRNLHLTCNHDSSTMREVKETGALASLCLICGALFFDRGEIEKALKAKVKESEFNKTKMTFTNTTIGGLPLTCPRCGGKFETKTKTKGSTSATMQFCPDCGGIWLEKGEYANVQAIFDLQKEEFKKSGKTPDNKDWLFYPYIHTPIIVGTHHSSGSSGGGSYSGGSFGGGGASSCVSHSSCVSSCACVSCACVACACACACAGGGAAGCSPKDKFNQIHLYDPPESGDGDEN